MKFKVGDRVKIVAYDNPHEYIEAEGIIEHTLSRGPYEYDVYFYDEEGEVGSEYFRENELEAVPETN